MSDVKVGGRWVRVGSRRWFRLRSEYDACIQLSHDLDVYFGLHLGRLGSFEDTVKDGSKIRISWRVPFLDGSEDDSSDLVVSFWPKVHSLFPPTWFVYVDLHCGFGGLRRLDSFQVQTDDSGAVVARVRRSLAAVAPSHYDVWRLDEFGVDLSESSDLLSFEFDAQMADYSEEELLDIMAVISGEDLPDVW